MRSNRVRLCPEPPLKAGACVLGGDMPLICVPLMGADDEAVDSELKQLSVSQPDIIELRVDAWDCVNDPVRSLARLRRIRGVIGELPVILTCRGHWEGGVKAVDDTAKFALYEGAVNERLVQFVDVELVYGQEVISGLRSRLEGSGAALIVSSHDFAKTPPRGDLWQLLKSQVEAGAQVAKLATMPLREEDVLVLMDVSLAFRRAYPGVPLITMSMGAMGAVSRVAGGRFGSDLTFAVGSVASAPGQMPIAVLRASFPVLYTCT